MSMENPDEVKDLESQQTLPPDPDDNHITGSHAASSEYEDVDLTGSTDLSPVLPQVSKEVPVSVEGGGGGGGSGNEANRQHADLESGVIGDVNACSGPRVNRLATTQAPAPSFFKLLQKSCKSYSISLLFLAAVLSIGFGIKEEGVATGWLKGLILMDAAIILVFLPAFRKFWLGNTQHQEVPKTNLSQRAVVVRRGKVDDISLSKVVPGDIVCLEKESVVPADGFFVSGEFSVLHNGTESTIDDNNPLLFHGAKVVRGKGRMLVKSMDMDTRLGEQMKRLSTFSQIIGLLVFIFILIGSFLRYMLERKDGNSGLPEIEGKATASKEIINELENFFMKQSASKLAAFVILLTAAVEKQPFCVALANYWRKKTLPAMKANIAQEMPALCTMRPATICIDTNVLNSPKVEMCYIGDEVIEKYPHAHTALSNAIWTSVSTTSSFKKNQLLLWTKSVLGMEKENFGTNRTDEEDRENEDIWLHCEGPATTTIHICTHYSDRKGKVNFMDEQKRMDYVQMIKHMQSKHLKTFAFAYIKSDGRMLEEHNITLIAMVGVNYYDTEIMEAVEFWRKEGTNMILLSDDNVPVLKDIAHSFGIILPNSNKSVVEGESFRTSDKADMMDLADKIYGMANSSPSDKLLLVQCLKEKSQEVLMVGDRSALREADVGVAMGTRSSEIARDPECSDIITLDGNNFGSVVKIIKFERCIYYKTQKYIQPEITMTIVSLLITLIATICTGHSTISIFQLFWVDMVVTLPIGFALLMEPPTEELMEQPPVRQTKGLNIRNTMWRNILIQAACQIIILVTLQQLEGETFPVINQKVSESMVFNTFVLFQLFNQINARQTEKKNVFSGILRHPWCLVSFGVALILQVNFMEIEHILAGSARLNWEEWGVCLLIGMASWPIDLAGKCASHVIKKVRDSYLSRSTTTSLIPSPASDAASSLELSLFDGMKNQDEENQQETI